MGRVFSNSPSNKLAMSSGQNLTAGSSITVAYWIFVRAGEGGGSAFSIGDLDNSGNDRCQCHSPYSDNVLYWDFGTFGDLTASYVGYFDKWTHVGLTSHGSGGGEKAIFLDGKKVNAITSSTAPTVNLSGGTIGGWNIGGGFWCIAQIADFMYWNIAIPDGKLADLAQGIPPVQPDSNLLMWLPLDAGQSPELDRTTNGRNATVTGTSFVADRPHPLLRRSRGMKKQFIYNRPRAGKGGR